MTQWSAMCDISPYLLCIKPSIFNSFSPISQDNLDFQDRLLLIVEMSPEFCPSVTHTFNKGRMSKKTVHYGNSRTL